MDLNALQSIISKLRKKAAAELPGRKGMGKDGSIVTITISRGHMPEEMEEMDDMMEKPLKKRLKALGK